LWLVVKPYNAPRFKNTKCLIFLVAYKNEAHDPFSVVDFDRYIAWKTFKDVKNIFIPVAG
jgi:hypothetical protein